MGGERHAMQVQGRFGRRPYLSRGCGRGIPDRKSVPDLRASAWLGASSLVGDSLAPHLRNLQPYELFPTPPGRRFPASRDHSTSSSHFSPCKRDFRIILGTMRVRSCSSSIGPIALGLLMLCPSPVAASWLGYERQAPSLPFQLPRTSQYASDNRQIATRIRDGIIHKIWGTPYKDQSKSWGHREWSPTSDPSPMTFARYGGDVVLRFRLTSTEEAKALAEAVNILFLDVWEFTTDWVDIRLAKDVVGFIICETLKNSY